MKIDCDLAILKLLRGVDDIVPEWYNLYFSNRTTGTLWDLLDSITIYIYMADDNDKVRLRPVVMYIAMYLNVM